MADTRTIGLLKREDIVKQLAHVAAIKGMTADELSDAGIATWHALAVDAVSLDRQGRELEASVIATLRHQESR